MRRNSMLSAMLAVAILLAGPTAAFAQEDEPDEDELALSARRISPEQCQVEPRTEEDLIAAFGLDAASVEEGPTFEAPEISIPLGEPANREVRNAVTDVVRELFACFNAGDVPRTAALLSDSGTFRFFGFGPRPEEADRVLRSRVAGTVEPREDFEYIRLIAVTDISIMPDGRVAAFVILNEPLLPPRGPETMLYVFRDADGRWLVDDYFDFTIIAPEEDTLPMLEEDGEAEE